MILLREDCLVFNDHTGEGVPCSVHELTAELVGADAQWLDGEMLGHAAGALLHYFKAEKGLTTVSMAEFTAALERVLRGLGLAPVPAQTPGSGAGLSPVDPAPSRVIDADLRELAPDGDPCGELFFFPRLRAALCSRLEGPPVVLRFRGLRACVKRLAGARRWTADCQQLNDQIVDYLRGCLTDARPAAGCLLVVR